MSYLETIKNWYPKAKTAEAVMEKVFKTVKSDLKLKPKQIVFADSVCSDEVNILQTPEIISKTIGTFKMGGLIGYPFAGLSGLNACAHHVPDGGALMLLYGPHIGITRDGKLGQIYRLGQKKPSACCGAASGALAALKIDMINANENIEIDYQMKVVEKLFLDNSDRIQMAAYPMIESTDVMYEFIEKRIDELVAKASFHCKYVILVGVVVINGDKHEGAFYDLRRFNVLDVSKGK